VIEDLIEGIEADERETRPGLSNDLYEAWRESPDKAFSSPPRPSMPETNCPLRELAAWIESNITPWRHFIFTRLISQ
jgi:hypothetical protein